MNRRGKIVMGFAAAAAVATAVALAVAIPLLGNPLRKSDESLHRYLLQKVPMGSSLENLQTVAAREGWRFDGTSKSRPHGGAEVTDAWVVLGEFRSKEVDSHWSFGDRGLFNLWIERVDWPSN
jgi:hypothetical protein